MKISPSKSYVQTFKTIKKILPFGNMKAIGKFTQNKMKEGTSVALNKRRQKIIKMLDLFVYIIRCYHNSNMILTLALMGLGNRFFFKRARESFG